MLHTMHQIAAEHADALHVHPPTSSSVEKEVLLYAARELDRIMKALESLQRLHAWAWHALTSIRMGRTYTGGVRVGLQEQS